MEAKTIGLDRFLDLITDNENTLPIEDAYEKVGWFRRGIDIRAEAGRSFPYDVMQNGEVLFTEDVMQSQENGTLEIIDTPPEIDIFDLLDNIIVDLDLYGAFYAIYETNRFYKNGRWRRLVPTSIKPVWAENGQIARWKRTIRKPNGGSQEIILQADELLYIWMPSIRSELGHGVGIGKSALMAATSLNNISRFQSAFFENGALNPMVVSIEGYETFSEREQSRIKDTYRRMLKGLKNAFNFLLVGGSTSATNLMQPLREMAMEEMTHNQRETIATALGIPQSLLFSNATSFATATQDDLNFYDKTIVPLMTLIEQQLNERLFKPNDYLLRFQKSRLEVYQQLESSKVDKLSTMLHDKAITIDEYRQFLNLPPMEEDLEPEPEMIPDPDPTMNERIDRLQDGGGDDERQAEELRQWRKYASKRFKEGSPEKALLFEAKHIDSALSDSIYRALHSVQSVDSVHMVFDDAQYWLTPHIAH